MKKTITCIGLSIVLFSARAQVGIGTATPNASAQLDITSSNKGLLIPRMTMSNRPASPATGLLIYQTDNTPGYYYYDGSSWTQLGGGWGLLGNTGTNGTQYVGTADLQKLIFKVNGVFSGCLDPSGSVTSFGLNAALNTTGSANTAIGFNTLKSNTTGFFNDAFGSSALTNNITGNFNTAIGSGALQSNINGTENTSLGNLSGVSISSGSDNVSLGYAALSNISTGNQNIGIGDFAGPFSQLNNSVSIGSSARALSSNSVCIGNTLMTDIGGYTGWHNLSDIRFKTDIGDENHGLDFILQLHPITYHMNLDKLNHFIYGEKADSLQNVKSLATDMHKKKSILYSGFSAQEVEAAAAKIGYSFSGVHAPENEHDHYSIDYSALVVPLVKAIQEQQQQIDDLKTNKVSQQQQIDLLREIIRLQDKRLDKLETVFSKNAL